MRVVADVVAEFSYRCMGTYREQERRQSWKKKRQGKQHCGPSLTGFLAVVACEWRSRITLGIPRWWEGYSHEQSFQRQVARLSRQKYTWPPRPVVPLPGLSPRKLSRGLRRGRM